MSEELHPMMKYLEELKSNEDRGAIATLRRGLNGDTQYQIAFMTPLIGRFIPENAPRWLEQQYYLTAALWAYYPEATEFGNMGKHFFEILDRENPDNNVSIERRFKYLLAANVDDLHYHLRQAVSFLKSKTDNSPPINWTQLLKDLRSWNHPDRFVQRRWAKAFWRNFPQSINNQS